MGEGNTPRRRNFGGSCGDWAPLNGVVLGQFFVLRPGYVFPIRRGMFWWGLTGFVIPFVGILHIIGALRLARPDSKWATEHYDESKMELSRARFADAV